MSENDEVTRLITVLKGFFCEHIAGSGYCPKDRETYLQDLISFHNDERPYGNKSIAQSIIFNLGWDYKRQMCFYQIPDFLEDIGDHLHQRVLETLKSRESLTYI